MKILCTGSRGFIGSHLLEELGGDGIDIKNGALQDVRHFISGKNYDVIFHAAAQASIPLSFENPELSHSHNVAGTLHMLEYARKTGAKVVFCSSSSVYELMSPYALQKSICEQYMKFYWSLGVKSIALRYFNVFGERQELANGGNALALSIFLRQWKDGEPFTIVGTGEQRRDFVYVKDVVDANRKAAEFLETATQFEVFDIGSGVNYSILEVADMIRKDHPKIFLPPRVEPFENLADVSKAKELLGWSPKVSLPSWLPR